MEQVTAFFSHFKKLNLLHKITVVSEAYHMKLRTVGYLASHHFKNSQVQQT